MCKFSRAWSQFNCLNKVQIKFPTPYFIHYSRRDDMISGPPTFSVLLYIISLRWLIALLVPYIWSLHRHLDVSVSWDCDSPRAGPPPRDKTTPGIPLSHWSQGVVAIRLRRARPLAHNQVPPVPEVVITVRMMCVVHQIVLNLHVLY